MMFVCRLVHADTRNLVDIVSRYTVVHTFKAHMDKGLLYDCVFLLWMQFVAVVFAKKVEFGRR